jgi:sugar phosphate isomerase/epimerase
VHLSPEALVLCAGTLRRGIPLAERAAAAQAAGFDGISLWGRDYQAARDEGLSDADIRALLDDHGVAVAEVDPLWSWLPGAADMAIPAAYDTEDMFTFDEARLFAVAEAVQARSVNVVDVFGGDWTLDQATESFVGLCQRAAERGLMVQLEFLPWSKIPDLATAWRIVRAADQPNGGIMLDAWHYFRSTPDDEVLRSIPGDRILGVQLSDAPAVAETNLMDAALHYRLLPGRGELDLSDLIATLRQIGAGSPFGVEVFSDALDHFETGQAAQQAGDTVRALLAAR